VNRAPLRSIAAMAIVAIRRSISNWIFYVPATMTTIISLGALSGFRWIERNIKTEAYAQLVISFIADRAPHQEDVVALVKQFGFHVSGMTHRFRREDALMEYGMNVHSVDRTSFPRMVWHRRRR